MSGADLVLQMRPVDELRAAVKGNRAAGWGEGTNAVAICAMIGFMRFPAFFSTTRKGLVRSIIVGRRRDQTSDETAPACSTGLRQAIRRDGPVSPQCPNSLRLAMTSGQSRMLSSGANLSGGR